MTTSSLIDLSAVKPEPIKKIVISVEQLKAAQTTFVKTLEEAVDLRFEQMQEMGKVAQSQIALAPGQQPPGLEIQMRLRFLDNTINRLTDLIIATRVIVDAETDPSFLAKFPKMVAKVQEAKEVIMDNIDKPLEKVSNTEGLLIAGFRDLERFHRVLEMAKY